MEPMASSTSNNTKSDNSGTATKASQPMPPGQMSELPAVGFALETSNGRTRQLASSLVS
jgi:hypothetical protein